jgi:hypothetical protein
MNKPVAEVFKHVEQGAGHVCEVREEGFVMAVRNAWAGI